MHTRSWEVLHTSIKKRLNGGQIATFILDECVFFWFQPPLMVTAKRFFRFPVVGMALELFFSFALLAKLTMSASRSL